MRRDVKRWSTWLGISAGVLAIGFGIWTWLTYPDPPDVATSDVNVSLAFMGSEEYNQMYEFHRRQYALDLVKKMREKSFDELMTLMLSRDPVHREVARNLHDSSFREEVENELFSVLLDKFYEQPDAKRNVYLTMIVMMEGQAMQRRPGEFRIPSADQFKKDLGEFMSRQPPNVQGKTARLIMDVRKQRQVLGMKDPW